MSALACACSVDADEVHRELVDSRGNGEMAPLPSSSPRSLCSSLPRSNRLLSLDSAVPDHQASALSTFSAVHRSRSPLLLSFSSFHTIFNADCSCEWSTPFSISLSRAVATEVTGEDGTDGDGSTQATAGTRLSFKGPQVWMSLLYFAAQSGARRMNHQMGDAETEGEGGKRVDPEG